MPWEAAAFGGLRGDDGLRRRAGGGVLFFKPVFFLGLAIFGAVAAPLLGIRPVFAATPVGKATRRPPTDSGSEIPFSFTPLPFKFPGTAKGEFSFRRSNGLRLLRTAARLEATLRLDGKGRLRATGVFFLRTADGLWYQTPRHLKLSEARPRLRVVLNLSADSADWIPVGHSRPWDEKIRARATKLGLSFWSRFPGRGKISVGDVHVVPAGGEGAAPAAGMRVFEVRASGEVLGTGELFQLTYRPSGAGADEVRGEAVFKGPDGVERRVPDFSYQDFFPCRTATGWALMPRGAPCRAVRFRPFRAGRYRWRVELRPAGGKRLSFSGAFDCVRGGPRGADFSLAQARKILHCLKLTPLLPAAVEVFLNGTSRTGCTSGTERPTGETTAAAAGLPPQEERVAAVFFSAAGKRTLGTVSAAAQRLPVEWSPRWHGFGGLGRFNEKLAWLLDRLLETEAAALPAAARAGSASSARGPGARPWVLLDGEAFCGHGLFNWFSNPLSRALGGPLRAPGEVFRDRRAFAAELRRMRYELARFGHSPALGDVLFTTKLNSPGAEKFHRRAFTALRPWLAATGRRFAALHPELLPGRRETVLCGFEELGPVPQRAHLGWKIFRQTAPKTKAGRVTRGESLAGRDTPPLNRISPASREPADPTEGRRAAWIFADFPGEAAVRWATDRCWYDAEALTVDVKLPADAPPDIRLQVTLRDGEELWYERLLPELLRPGDWNRLTIPLRDAGRHALGRDGWRALGHDRPFGWWTRTRIKELGLRFHSRTAWQGVLLLDRVTLVRDTTPAVAAVAAAASGTGGAAARKKALLLKSAPRGPGAVYEWAEWILDVPEGAANPFDPEQLDLTGEFTDAAGRTIRRPAFFYLPYRLRRESGEEKIVPAGAPDFRVRFAPLTAGRYEVRFILRRGGKVVAEIAGPPFTAGPARHPGFVRVSEKDPRWFETCDGKFFYLVGHNLRSPTDDRNKENWDFKIPRGRDLALVTDILKKMGAAGENYARMWMMSGWLGLEGDRRWTGYQGTGRYNTANAWKLDRVLAAAEDAGVRLELVLNYHGQWNEKVYDSEWLFNPYNRWEYDGARKTSGNRLVGTGRRWARPGGFLERPDEVFTNRRCRKLLQQRFRYIVARWGASTSVFSWGLWNEVNAVDNYHGRLESWNDPQKRVANWHRDIARWFRSADSYGRPLTTQFNTGYGDPAVWRLPGISYTQMASYNWGEGCLQTIASEIRGEYWPGGKRPRYARRRGGIVAYGKPALCDEFGGNVYGGKQDMLEEELHVGLWGSVMLGLSGTAQFWWWNFVHEKNLYHHFRALTAYLKGEDFRGKRDRPVRPAVESTGGKLSCYARVAPRWVIGWVVRREVLKSKFIKERHRGPRFLPAAKNLSPVAGGVVRLKDLQPGAYEAEFWDTLKGVVFVRAVVRVGVDGVAVLSLPPVKSDVAFKLRPK